MKGTMQGFRERLAPTKLGDVVRAVRKRSRRLPRTIVTPHGLRITAPAKYTAWYQRGFEPVTFSWLAERLSPGDAVVDGGAHVGFLTAYLATLVGAEGRVFAFEPSPQNLRFLERNVSRNALEQVTVRAVALGATPGRSEFHITGSSDSDGFYEHPNTRTRGVVSVERVRLDDEVKTATLVKLDLEGAELEALAGMPELLSKRPDLLIEWTPSCQRAAGHAPDLLPRHLIRLGYEVTVLDDLAGRRLPLEIVLERSHTDDWFCNLACVPRT